jgi:hypothetical protein
MLALALAKGRDLPRIVPTLATVSLGSRLEHEDISEETTGRSIPYAHKVDLHGLAVRLLEARTQYIIGVTGFLIHFVGKGDLFSVVFCQQPDLEVNKTRSSVIGRHNLAEMIWHHLVQHASEGPCDVGPAAKAKQADLVAFSVVLHEEPVAVHDVRVEI